MTAVVQRRPLRFNDLDEVVRDAEELLAKGYEKAGKWDLAQVCEHVTNWMTYPLDGFPKPPLPVRAILRLMRATIGRRMFEKTLRDGMSPGQPTSPLSVPPPDGDAAAAVAKLRAAVERWKAHTGKIHPSPLFGRTSKDEATKLQLVHAGHHLSFLVPK
jgi:hypothetical protein